LVTKSFTLKAYSDTDWACDPDDRRQKIYVALMDSLGLISFEKALIARSSTKAEYTSLAKANTATELLWVQTLSYKS
ncbi:hypothetical protein CR513_24431, partial [Mucuna pruriens]